MAKRLRLSAIIPFVFSVVSFALVLVLMLAGTRVNQGQGFYLMSLNTSKVATGTIKFTPVSSQAPSPMPNDPTGILGGIMGGLQGALGNLTGQVDSSLQNIESDFVSAAVDALGIHDVYNIYLRNMCEGDFADDNTASSTSQATISSCPEYHKLNITNKVPSYAVVGTTNVSVPLVASIGSTFGSLQDTLQAAGTAFFVLLLLGLIFSGVVFLLSLAAIVAPNNRIIALGSLIFSQLAPAALVIAAIVTTVLVSVATSMLNGLGDALTISAVQGGGALALIWVAWALSMISGIYWFLTWWVSYRRSKWVRTRRHEDEVGNFRQTFVSTRRNVRKDPEKNTSPHRPSH